MFIPVNVTSFSDVVFPWTVHYALGSDKKGFSKCAYVGGCFLADLITLVFRLVILIPRGIYKCTQIPAIKLAHPICSTRTTGMYNDLPIKVGHNSREFYFALVSMHEIQARRYFTKAKAEKNTRWYTVAYSETDTKSLAELKLSSPPIIIA